MTGDLKSRLTCHPVLCKAVSLLAVMLLLAAPTAAATLNFSVDAGETVIVTGAPRIAIDVGGVTRFATYASGSGTSTLTFSYGVQPGDFDANGITLTSPLDLNGGAITDIAGNPASNLAFTLPDTSTLKVQTYTASFTTSPITNTNANAVSFAIGKAPTGAAFTYTISSSGGAGTVTGSGTIGANLHTVSGVDISGLATGTLTLSVTIATAAGGTGAAKTATATPTFTGVLDSLPAAAAAFSVRRLAAGHTGPLLRVRRSSDGAAQDIGATVGGNLDTTALASFCDATSCFVSTLYDQSGSGTNVVQATAASQPRLVNAGTVESEGARPALNFTASGQFLAAPPLPGQSVQGSANAVARLSNSAVNSNRHVLGNRGFGASGNVGRIIRAVAGGTGWLGANINGSLVNMPGSTTQQRVVTIVSSASSFLGVLDGAATAGTATSAYLNSTWDFWIGGTGGGASTGDWVGTISEATVFNVTLSTSERQALERDQGAYYGITVQ